MNVSQKEAQLYREWESINIYDGPEVFLKTLSLVSEKSGLLFASHFAQSEICNGGFRQLFLNSTGVLVPEAIRGFVAMGMPTTAGIVQRASLVFGEPYPRERLPRHDRLNGLAPKYFDGIDDEFFAVIGTENGGFEQASAKYVDEPS
jgi:hypothetical protein